MICNSTICRSGRLAKRAGPEIRQRIVMFALALTFLVAWAALASAQTYTVLHSFSGGSDGADPEAPVIVDATTGNLYGATFSGGSGGCQYPGCGTVFEVTSAGIESVLHAFTGPSDGAMPRGVSRDAKGNLFGTAWGGAYGEGDGVIFKIDPSGVEGVLYSLKGGADGEDPSSGLVQDPNSGNFYGVTFAGGADNGGTLYSVTPSGAHTVLYSFGGPGGVGDSPASKPVLDAKTGNLYGLLPLSGLGCGVIFQLTPTGAVNTVHVFTGHPKDGCEPGWRPGVSYGRARKSVWHNHVRRNC